MLQLLLAAISIAAVAIDPVSPPIALTSAAGVHWTLSAVGPRNVSSLPALVPGDVNDDLERANELPPLWYADNAREEPWWVPVADWTYKASIIVPPGYSESFSASFRFDGCDYNCSVIVDGTLLGTHQGSFLGFEFDASAAFRAAKAAGRESVTLQVLLHSPPALLIDALYNSSALSPAQTYGVNDCLENRIFPLWKSKLNQWDFAPKLWQLGLWREVWLIVRRDVSSLVHLDLKLKPHTLLVRLQALRGDVPSPSSATLNVSLGVSVSAATPHSTPVKLLVQWEAACLTDARAPKLAANSSHQLGSHPGTTDLSTLLQLPSPRLWWPNGYGAQHRYQIRASLFLVSSRSGGSGGSGSGQEQELEQPVLVDRASAKFGVRQLENVQNPGPDSWRFNQYEEGCGPCILNSSCLHLDSHGQCVAYPGPPQDYYQKDRWLFQINGRKLFARGGNWLPADMAFGKSVREYGRLRALLSMARQAGYTFFRIWGGGVVESQHFYDLCDEFGILLQQDFPAAGCGYAKFNATGGSVNASWAWLYSHTNNFTNNVTNTHGLSVIDSWRVQIPLVLQQLMNHPSVVRYTLGNEFYLNRSYCPVQAVFEDTIKAMDPSRMARQADPTNIGQRHGPYVFEILGGSGYDTYGGRWPLVGGCDAANYDSEECCPAHLSDQHGPGCRYTAKSDSGPGDPFEWSEFGATAISDLETLKLALPPSSLSVAAVGDAMWGYHKAGCCNDPPGMWLDEGHWSPLFASKRADFADLEAVVRASQFAQAEAYRYMFQAGRRRKWHRSLLAHWTFNEPWPNAAHGCVVDYYGRPKQAYYYIRQANAMVDVSLHYSDLWTAPAERLRVTAWVDSELDQPLVGQQLRLSYFTPAGAQLGEEAIATNLTIGAASALEVGRPSFAPPAALNGSVLIVRARLLDAKGSVVATSDYTFSVRSTKPPNQLLAPLMHAPATELTLRAAPNRSVVVSTAAAGACALFVKLVLYEGASTPTAPTAPTRVHVAYSVFDRNYFVLTPGESVHVGLLELGTNATTGPFEVCAHAWNTGAPKCVQLP